MKTRNKFLISIIAIMLSCVIMFTAIAVYGNANKGGTVSASTRTVELSQSTLDAQSILNEFDDAKLIREGTTTYFEGYKPLETEKLSEIDYISEDNFEELENCTVKYNFSYDSETNVVTIAASTALSDGSIEIDEIRGVGFINDDGEIDAVMNVDGEGVLLSEMRSSGLIENCGWFSRLIKKVVKAVVVAVAVAAVVVATAAVVVATAGAAAPALVAVGVGTTAAYGAGAAAGLAAGAIFYSTMGSAAMQAGVELGEQLGNGAENVAEDIENAVYSAYTRVKQLAKAIITALSVPTINNKCYHFAYIFNASLIIDKSVSMNYLEAYAVLVASGLVNAVDVPKDIFSEIRDYVLSPILKEYVNKIKDDSKIKMGKFGIYTYEEQDAANLAYASGAFIKGIYESETHDDRVGSGYYYHFHDINHLIHIWYGDAS